VKISNTILAAFQLLNEMSAKAAKIFVANLDYLFTSVAISIIDQKSAVHPLTIEVLAQWMFSQSCL